MGLSLTTTIALIRQLAMRAVPTDLIFVDATARDAFFASNPDRVDHGLTVIINSNTTPTLQLYQGVSDLPYNNTQWQDITSVIQGPKGDKGDAGQLSATNLAYVSSSSNIPIGDQDGTFTSPYSTIQRAIDNLNVSQDGIEVVDGSTYTENITLAKNIRLFAPNASLVGNITTGAFTLSLDILEVTGTIDDESNVSGIYTNNGRTTVSTGATEFDLVTTLAKFTSNLEIDDTLFFGDATTNNNWRIRRDGVFLRLERLEDGTWVSRGSFGSSLESDRFILENLAGTIVFIDDDGNEKSLLKPSVDGSGSVIGNSRGRVALVSNGEVLDVKFDSTTENTDVVNDNQDESQTGTTFTYQFTSRFVQSIISGTMTLSGVPANTVYRLTLIDQNNVLLAENATEFEFSNGTAPSATNGDNLVSLIRTFAVPEGFVYSVTLEFSNSVTILGSTEDLNDGRGARFLPRYSYSYYSGVERELADRSEVNTHTSDFTINSTNIMEYRDSTILFTQDSASDVTLTITDGVFEDNDELTILFYPSTDVNRGQVTVQAGATGTINGQNTIQMLRATATKIKHISGNNWYIVFEDSHPVTVRRDTPTIPQMQALLRSSINENSALWIVANDQLTSEESTIDPNINIQALRDDLLDLDGNPIPLSLTQKRGILLEAGTICRLFRAEPNDTIIRVIMTPRQATTSVRNLVQNSDLTINSANYTQYRNDLLLYTNVSGVPTVTIADGTYMEDDEIYIKHYSLTPSMSVGVDVTQQNGNVEGMNTLELRNNASVRLKNVGLNSWRIMASHGLSGGAPTPVTPEVHGFSIDIPSRVTPNQSPDPVNDSHTVTYSVTNHSLITSATLYIGATTFPLTVPTSEGVNTQTLTISGINISSATTYNMFVELNGDNTLRSNIQVLNIANPAVHEQLYYDSQTSGIAGDFNYQSATAQSQEILTNENTLTITTYTGNRYFAIAQPATETDISSIFISGFDQIGAFTKTDNAVQINSVNYDVWISNNALDGSIVSGNTVRVVR